MEQRVRGRRLHAGRKTSEGKNSKYLKGTEGKLTPARRDPPSKGGDLEGM